MPAVMLRFEFTENDQLPPMAWCARLLSGNAAIQVEHGSAVECSADSFVEGAWDGDFAARDFSNALVVLGSAGKLTADCATFYPTSHIHERLFSIRVDNTLTVSNSLNYVLEATGSELDPRNWMYESDLMSFQLGYADAVKSLSLRNERHLDVHYIKPFTVSDSLVVQTLDAPAWPAFPDFEDYLAHLRQLLASVTENACHPQRRQKYRLVTTLSSGYDSTVCAVLAKELGCELALTYGEARQEYAGTGDLTDDSGAPIAEALGMEIRAFSRNDYLDLDTLPETKYIATGGGGDDVVTESLAPELPGTLLLTGIGGDTLWGIDHPLSHIPDHYRCKFSSGASLHELRLAEGFVHVPVPLLAYPRYPDLRRISLAKAMLPWRLHNHYDRPIARRIGEQGGVPRELFGQHKRAITAPLWIAAADAGMMGRASLQDYHAYMRAHTKQLGLHPITMKLLRSVRRLYLRAAQVLREMRDPTHPEAYQKASAKEPLRFHWAVDRYRRTYSSTILRDTTAE